MPRLLYRLLRPGMELNVGVVMGCDGVEGKNGVGEWNGLQLQ